MEKLKNIPSLRFPEFDGEWENKKLGFIGDYLGGGTPKTSVQEYWKGDIPWISSSDITENDFHNINIQKHITEDAIKNSATKIIPANSLIIVSRVGVGKFAINKKIVCTSQDFTNIVIDSKIVHAYFSAYNLYKNIGILHNISQGTSIKGFTNVDLKETKLTFPTLQEQTKIASFLTALDDRLQALKQKKTLLEQYKKGVMQKIFSQELRFKDENGNEYPDWEEKKLGEIFYSEKGKGISKNKVIPNGNFECVLYGELYTKYNEVIYNVVSTTNEVDGIKSKKGDLLIPSSTTTSGIDLANVTALNKDDVLLGGDITVLRSNTEINNVFYAYYLSNHKKEEIASYAQGSTIVHLYYSHIKDMEIHTLSFSEQTKIANFLSAIDDKINYCQLQVEKMEVWKKGLLQQMFV